jgi:site-specific recombinase XerD
VNHKPEPYYFKRSWKSPEGGVKWKWLVRWSTGMKRKGRAVTHERGGFVSKEAARNFYNKFVLPALRAGHDTPWQMNAEEDERHRAARTITVGEWLRAMCDKRPVHLKESSFQDIKSAFNAATRFFTPERKLASLKKPDIEAFLASNTSRGTPPKPDTIRGRFIAVRAAFGAAVKAKFMEVNPCDDIKVPKAGKGRLRHLTREEAAALLEACRNQEPPWRGGLSGDYLHALAAGALYTGGRRDEVFHLEWTDLNRQTSRVMIQPKPHFNWTTKNGLPRTIGVNPDFFKALDEYQAARRRDYASLRTETEELERWLALPMNRRGTVPRPQLLRAYKQPPSARQLIAKAHGVLRALEVQLESTLIFPNPAGEPMTVVPRGFEKAVEDAGLAGTGVTFHTLRHTFASQLVMACVDLPSLKELMGHASIQTTMRYAHLSPDHAVQKGMLMPTMRTETAGAKIEDINPDHEPGDSAGNSTPRIP